MDTQAELNSAFGEVWARVTGGGAEKDDISALNELITLEIENCAFYSAAIKRLNGAPAAFFKELMNESSRRLSKLQAMYFLASGENAAQKSCGLYADISTLSALREAYRRANETAASYRCASMELSDKSLCSIAMLYAEQASASADKIAAFTEKLMH